MRGKTFQVQTGPSGFAIDVDVTDEEMFTLSHCEGCGARTGSIGLCSRCEAEDSVMRRPTWNNYRR